MPQTQTRNRALRVSAFTLVLLLAGCGGALVAPDALVEDPGAEAFLDQVAKDCGDKSIGNSPLNYLINESDDAYFIDVTTKLYFGRITPEQYRDDINGLYPIGANEGALRCIIALLPR